MDDQHKIAYLELLRRLLDPPASVMPASSSSMLQKHRNMVHMDFLGAIVVRLMLVNYTLLDVILAIYLPTRY